MECPKAICKHLQILLLVGCANSEALHQRKSSLVPFFSEMLQRSCVAQQSWGYSVFVFFTSWRPIGLGMLTGWKNTCRSPVWSYARMGDSFSASRLAAGRDSSSPEQQKLCHTWLPHAQLLGECHPLL